MSMIPIMPLSSCAKMWQWNTVVPTKRLKKHVVRDAERGDEHIVAMQVGRFVEPVAQLNAHSVAREHAESGADELALVGIGPGPPPRHSESGRLNVECRLQQTVLSISSGGG